MISVIMPTYNAAAYVVPAISSILNQTFGDFELIVVDDGSTDSTAQLVGQFAARDPRVVFIQSEHRGGNAARNIAARRARFPWVASMDADDVSLPHRLETQLKAAQQDPDVVIWGAYIHHINSRGDVLSLSKAGPTSREEFHEIRRSGKLIHVFHPTAFIKREVLLKIGGYDEQFPAAQDVELYDRMAEFGPILALPMPLVNYRVHMSAISMTKFREACSLVRYLQNRHAHRLRGEPLPSLEQYVEEYQRQPALVRWRHHLDDLGRLNYRRAGMCFGQRDPLRTAFFLSLATLLKPVYSTSRAYDQVVRPLLHRHSARPRRQAKAVAPGA